jgi:hypothetical protein
MVEKLMPKYPVYVPSKGRWDACYTAEFLVKDEVPFYLVVEEQEAEQYAQRYGHERLLILPFSNAGSVIPARNWIKEHSISLGAESHWQLDDNMREVRQIVKNRRMYCSAGYALNATETFVDRYDNIALAGLSYYMFGIPIPGGKPPFYRNVHVYSCTLILNRIPYLWRGRYNEDTDICLQALSGGWCTVLMNAFMVQKIRTMMVKGGNTAELYQDDGRLKMAKSLERLWPGVVETRRRFGRPQHFIKNQWQKFDTPFHFKDGLTLDSIPAWEHKTELMVKAEPKNARLKAMLDEHQK